MSERFEVGKTYVSAGPNPMTVEILELIEDESRYRVKGARHGDTLVFGVEHMWSEVNPGQLAGMPVQATAEPAPARRPAPAPAAAAPADAWHNGRLIAFDLETTAPQPEEARIVTAAIAACGAGLATETLELLADPGVEIPDGAAAIHGITIEHAREHGHPIRDVVIAIVASLRSFLATGASLVIFNARYDLTVLDRECRRHGVEPLDMTGVRVIDPFVIDKHLHRYRRGSRKLDAQAAHYGATLAEAHDAASDAIAAARVAWCIGAKGKVIRRTRNYVESKELTDLQTEWETVRYDLDLLHAAQVRWALAERHRFAEYKRKSGDHEEAARIAREIGWPVLELVDDMAAVA